MKFQQVLALLSMKLFPNLACFRNFCMVVTSFAVSIRTEKLHVDGFNNSRDTSSKIYVC